MKYLLSILTLLLLTGCYTHLGVINPNPYPTTYTPTVVTVYKTHTTSYCLRYVNYEYLYRNCIRNTFLPTVVYRPIYNSYNNYYTLPSTTKVQHRPVQPRRTGTTRTSITRPTKYNTSTRTRNTVRDGENRNNTPNVIRPTRSRTRTNQVQPQKENRSTRTEERSRSQNRSQNERNNNQKRNNN